MVKTDKGDRVIMVGSTVTLFKQNQESKKKEKIEDQILWKPGLTSKEENKTSPKDIWKIPQSPKASTSPIKIKHLIPNKKNQ